MLFILISRKMIEMLFSKKKKELVMMHYEGLPGFKQDFPCKVDSDESNIIFTNEHNSVVNLPISQIQNIDSLPEMNFMGKYHNNPVNTAKTKNAVKWFYVINYTSSSGEAKYVALWGTDGSIRKFFDELNAKLSSSSSGTITL